MADWDTLIHEISALLGSGGAAAAPIFAFLWWLERGERLEDREQQRTWEVKQLDALNEVKTALATLAAIFNSRGGK